jgi:CRP/FNR family transcriptional regulator, cyclic AMP receptor protein
VGFADGSFLFREGQPAEKFFLILDGKVSLETAAPGSGAIVVQTIGGGEVAGFSWLLEPHRWEFDGRAVGTVRAIGLDGARLREECDEDPALGYELMRRFARLATRRMQAARIRLLDVYGRAHA